MVPSGTVPTTNCFVFTTTNKFSRLGNNTLGNYGNYKSIWMLDTDVSGHYAYKYTHILNQQNIKRGIRIGCANNRIMEQQAEGELLFEKIPEGAKGIHVPNVHILTGETKEAIQEIIRATEAENNDNILMTVLYDHDELTWKEDKTKIINDPQHVANSMH